VSFVVKEDKTLDPMDVGFLGFWALVPRADGVANLIEQLRLLRCWKTDHSISFGTTAETAGGWEDSLSVGLAIGGLLDYAAEGCRNPYSQTTSSVKRRAQRSSSHASGLGSRKALSLWRYRG